MREARLRAGLTQTQLAERVGTTQSAIARLERSRSTPSLARLRQLVAACGLELRVRLAAPADDVPVEDQAPIDRGAEAGADALEGIAEVVQVLDRHGVRWILAGGLAAALHGAAVLGATPTVVPHEGRRNLEALAASLNELGARRRVDGGSLPFERDAPTIEAAGRISLTSTGGPFHLDLRPEGTGGFGDLARDAISVRRWGLDLLVASLVDIVRMADAARADDAVVAALRRHLATGRTTGRSSRAP